MSDRMKQIQATAVPVTATEKNQFQHFPGTPTDAVVIARVDLAWMASVIGSTEAIMRERNTWARDLADMRDERDTAREDLDKFKAAQAETLEWATNRVADLEAAIQRVLEADVVDVNAAQEPEPLNHAIRNLRAVWARA